MKRSVLGLIILLLAGTRGEITFAVEVAPTVPAATNSEPKIASPTRQQALLKAIDLSAELDLYREPVIISVSRPKPESDSWQVRFSRQVKKTTPTAMQVSQPPLFEVTITKQNLAPQATLTPTPLQSGAPKPGPLTAQQKARADNIRLAKAVSTVWSHRFKTWQPTQNEGIQFEIRAGQGSVFGLERESQSGFFVTMRQLPRGPRGDMIYLLSDTYSVVDIISTY